MIATILHFAANKTEKHLCQMIVTLQIYSIKKRFFVLLGSKNRPAWPIAPGIDNGTVPR